MATTQPDPTPPKYNPKHPESYYLALLVLGAALRQNDHAATASDARKVAATVAQALDAGKLEVDGQGELSSESGKGAVLLKLAGDVVTVVDAHGRPVMIPAPKNPTPDQEREAVNGQIPLRLYSGAAMLAARLGLAPLTEAERFHATGAAALMLAARASVRGGDVLGVVAQAIEDVRLLSPAAGWDRRVAPASGDAPDTSAEQLRGRIVAALEGAGPFFADEALAARVAPDPAAAARALYEGAAAVFGRVFSAELRRDLGLSAD